MNAQCQDTVADLQQIRATLLWSLGYPDDGAGTPALLRRLVDERDMYRQHSIALHTLSWRLAVALGEEPATSSPTAHRVTDVFGLADRILLALHTTRRMLADVLTYLAAEGKYRGDQG